MNLRHVLACSLSLTSVVVALSCGGGTSRSRNELQVMSFAPEGVIDKAETIVIRFDEPVVDEALVSKRADPALVKVSPAFAWNGFWQDQRTLVIDPSEKLAPSTKYTVALQGELAKRTKNFELSFVHRPIAIEGVAGVDPEMISPDGELPLAFNVPVTAVEVASHCTLVGSTEVGLVGMPGAPAQNVKVKPVTPLARGGTYVLTCTGVTGAGGNLPLAQPYSLPLAVRPELAVTDASPAGGDVPADEVALSFSFSTPVTLDAIRKAIKSEPPIPNLEQGYLGDEGREYHVTTDLDTQTRYKITVDGLVDTFGQPLAAPKTVEFKTGDARPRISMERGIYALEASAKGYPVWTRSIGKYEVECAGIPKERLVQVLTTDMNYDPWGGNNDTKPIDWKAIKLQPRTTPFKPSTKNKWRMDELDLGKTCASGPGQRGVYLAEVRSDEIVPDANRGWLNPRRNRVLANVTDLGVLIKAGTASGVVWVTSLASGRPVAGATVSVYTPQGKRVHTGVTAADGLIKIPGTSVLKQQPATSEETPEFEDWDSYRSQRLIAVVEHGSDLAVVDGNWANGIQLWNFGVSEDRRGGATKLRGFIQSDRGLYRPGEGVHFKGLAREIKQGRAPSIPSRAKPVEIEVQDSRGQTVLTTQAKLSAFGGFAFDMTLAEDASVGDYYVRAKLGDQTFREKFSVEEFRPATFEVKVKSAAANPQPGEQLRFELDAKYLMGSPASEASVEWGLRKRAHRVAFPGYDAYTFSADPQQWWWYEPQDDYGEFIGDGKGKTDAQGHLVIEARDTAKAFTGPVDYILSANVTDSADQTMGKSAIVTAHKTQFYLGLHANEFVQAVGMPFGVNLVALDTEGKPRATKAKLAMTRSVHSCTWEQLGARSFQRCEAAPKKMFEREISIAGAGSHTERIFPTEPGDYVIEVTSKDALGNEVKAASQIWVIGKGEAFWSGDEGARMTLVSGKPTYEIGDTARLVAQANLVKPTALVTVERDGIIDAQVKQLSSASEGLELKIADAWAPNVYAGVTLVQGRQGPGDKHRPQFKMGLVELKVASTHKQLDVRVDLDQATVRPGDKVTGKVVVSKGGKPVKAEVSLSAADEGVLQLISYATPNPMKTFYASYGLGVDAGTNWNRVARIADPTKGDPDEGGDGGSTLGAQRVRSKFVSSAYWNGMLVTNDKGEIEFSFTAPDNLTAFRLMAVAADGGAQFGAGEQRLTINKPVMAAPALPRFLRSGDASSVGIVVHNTSDLAGKAIVTAKADGAVLATTTQTIDLAANSSQRVRFSAKASDNAAATFEFTVALGADKAARDAVRVTVPIDRPRVIDNRLVVEKSLGNNGTWSGSLGISADVLRDESTLSITVDRTGVGDLVPGLRSLVEYPYGCLEQTMSRFVPLVAAKDLANTLDDATLKGTKANAFIKAGTAKVIRHQQGDGHFSLWPQSQTYPHLTAYALWGLTLAQQAGEEVPFEVFDNGTRALQQWATKAGVKPDGDGAVLAMGAYVMALRGTPDASLHARLYAVRSGLPKWGQAFLLRALAKAKADPAQIAEVKKLVEAGITVEGNRAMVRETQQENQYHYMHSDIRATAMTLAALLEVDPQHKQLDALAAGLKAARTKQGDWVSTQETLWSLVALGDYGKRASAGETTAVIKVGGKVIVNKKLVGAELAKLDLAASKLESDRLEIAVDRGANVAVRVREARVDALQPIARGFTLTRSYLDAKGNPATSFKAGEMVTVKLELVAKDAQPWVALVDPIPAGFDVVNPKLAAGGTSKDAPQPTTDPWARRWGFVTWDHQELRDDRVLWFADRMAAGTYAMTYQARATIDGTFAAMPATVEAMYAPDVRARTARTVITVTK